MVDLFSANSASSSCRPSVLVVDDDDVMQCFLENLLTPQYEVIVVGRADAALSHLQQQQPDAILLDLNLPDADGHALLERMQNTDGWANIPIMVVSGREGSSERVTSLRLGADDHLSKPFNPEELRERLSLLV